jgi:hypothetical protein
MGVIELFLAIVVVVLLGWLAVYALAALAPGHPATIDNIIWFVVIVIVLVFVANAFGLIGRDPLVPRLR